jgi:endonuclease/exonuclease/phosphatase (EEP) superfamily protein YafD
LQYILIGLLSVIVLVGFRSWKLLPVALVVVVFNATFLRPYYVSYRGDTSTTQLGKIRLIQVNLLYTNKNADRAIATIEAADADVVILQELTDEWIQQLHSLNRLYPHTEWQPRPRGSGMAILSRLPLQETRVLEFEPGTSRPAILTRVTVGAGSVTLLGVHPTTPITPKKFTSRNSQFREAAAILASVAGPKVLIGDLNTTMWSPYFHQLLNDAGLRDARLGFGLQTTWPWPLPSLFRLPIDHCLVSEQVKVANVRVGSWTGSDHFPLIIDLII